ncbi:type III secretion system export apparatus subunit SctU [Novilysobacter defluvii]|uniref:Type III secretion protein n=1 Tax=Lysobacter defluvii IMMIB APB-9 = DSM 18482 TaxID=1385515 RepID=A0A0A0M9N3_9GAMM|nr:type III secretion system export apparatus subunit SctU [Lysobacter defluvii]KGO98712.1 type III secretion protein [Lysobacter defluvii IMMIB APB-9 = DSM 18482]
MASKDQGADKTEKPTAKRIRDARKEGNVSKSKDLTSTVLVLGWLLGGWMLMGFMGGQVKALFQLSLDAMHKPFLPALVELGWAGVQTLAWLVLPLAILAVMLGLLVEFLQVGPLLAFKKVTPNMEKLNPAEGIKKMFSMDNLVELVKSIVKSTALIGIGLVVLWGLMEQLLLLPYAPPAAMGEAIWTGLVRIVIWTVFVFFFISALDSSYQKYSYLKQLRMSKRDIKQEVKDNEGDPYIKQRRKQLHQEWSQQNMLSAVRGSNVVVTNPTHIAVALQYEHGVTDLPVVVAKGEGHEAEMIRRAAEEEGIPIMQNIPLARGLHEKVDLDDYIGKEFFEAVAEVLQWAESVRDARG